jgi:hypothetical protein
MKYFHVQHIFQCETINGVNIRADLLITVHSMRSLHTELVKTDLFFYIMYIV